MTLLRAWPSRLAVACLLLVGCASSTGTVPPGPDRAGPGTELGPGSELGPGVKDARVETGQLGDGPRSEAGAAPCKSDTDCAGTATPFCSGTGSCVACEESNPQHGCTGGKTCCKAVCVDTSTDVANCGGCGKPCALAHATAGCTTGGCTVVACAAGWLDCDLAASNGCETAAGATGVCTCAPNASEPCYSGPAGTDGVGPCTKGTHTCDAPGTSWGACVGEVLPQSDVCTNTVDDDCDGIVNNGYPTAAGCGCVPSSTQACYSGPAATKNVGACVEGQQTCDASGKDWGPCTGEVLPQPDVCANSIDDDCDGIVNNGFASGAAGCTCTPGATQSCYTGPTGTLGKGICKAGTQTCAASGTSWGPCVGEVTPQFEICGNGIDEDCSGKADDPPDLDGDGWTVCDGDCCDWVGSCGDPKLVNPGAFDVPGNKVDDDCDGVIDNPPPLCDTGLASNSAVALDYARAIDLCQLTTENPPANQKKWGVISAQLLLADGTGVPAAAARAIRNGFGTVVKPQMGSNLAVLSTGHAADSSDANPAFASFQQGQDMGTSSGFPADWLAANGGALPNAPGCPSISSGTKANDPVMLKLRIRVPTNAQSFSVGSYFFSAEYPEWVCSPYNDFFVALLDSTFKGTPANPTDKNLAFYDPPPAGAPYYPVGVNLAFGNTGLFRQCVSGQVGCAWGVTGNNTCVSVSELAGTGFDPLASTAGYYYPEDYCQVADRIGGGTGWLVTRGNIVPGETVELRFAIWDTSDHWWDSVLLLDNFQWSVTPSKPGTDG